MTTPPANVLDLPLEERAEMALKAAVEKVIVEHARQGLPIYIWHPKTLQKLARNGEIEALHVGKLWRFRASALNRWIAS
jgi:excisionase family DNA binding protein